VAIPEATSASADKTASAVAAYVDRTAATAATHVHRAAPTAATHTSAADMRPAAATDAGMHPAVTTITTTASTAPATVGSKHRSREKKASGNCGD
jgi:hypothetical protein